MPNFPKLRTWILVAVLAFPLAPPSPSALASGEGNASRCDSHLAALAPELLETAIRDLRDWSPPAGKRPVFFEDVHQGKLHFYFSESHGSTRRAATGLNPPILAAIRYLTKAFQYELEVQGQDLAQISRIVDQFDPTTQLGEDYVKGWIERNGKKLIQNAVNIEYATRTLERLGLRDKLLATGNLQDEGSFAWWMSRVPLPSFPVGRGSGRTARELGIEIVAHETNSYLSYESITRAHTGEPNVLTSRQGFPGESASLGNGFYTRMGR